MTMPAGAAQIEPFEPARSNLRKPSLIAKWLLLAFAVGVLAYMAIPFFKARTIPEAEALLSFAFLPWFVGPAAVAALRAARARSRAEAWLFVAAEVAVIAHTAWAWTLLALEPDAQNGVAMLVYPVLQCAALLVFATGVVAVSDLAPAKDRRQNRPRTTLLATLAIASVMLVVVLAWLYGYLTWIEWAR